VILRRKGDRPSRSTQWSRLNILLGERRRTVAALAVTSILSGFAEAGTLALIAALTTTLVKGTKHANIHAGPVHVHVGIWSLVGIALGLTLLRLAMQIPISVLPARIASDVQAKQRSRVFHAFTRASWEVQSRDREGQLQDTMTTQVMQATGGALQATSLITTSFNFIALLATAFLIYPAAAGAVLGAGFVLFALLRPLRALGVRRAHALSQALSQYASGVSEAVRVAEETQVFGVAAAQRARIDALVERARDYFFGTQLLNKLIPNLFQSLILIALVLGLGAVAAAGNVHTTALATIILLLLRSARSGQQGLTNFQSLAQSLPFIERVQEAENRYKASIPTAGPDALEGVQTMSFESVSYAYRPEQPVLSGISFEVQRGEVVGIIGPTGAGKSTLVQILLQLRKPQQGAYRVNGELADQFRREDWHRLVAYVPQEPRLLHASVADNIRYLRELDDDALEEAARLAHIHDEIMSWPMGYDTIVGPRADAVSGGQQQRLCLARALAARPEVIVLDEPTSALDPHSESLIGESLTGLKHELTLFIIAHRMSTLDICDRVMVIIDGKLVAFDTIDLLQRNNSYYRSASAIAAGTPGRTIP
jgi:ABC-type multidrug transport system fused ATPase/permease subunit